MEKTNSSGSPDTENFTEGLEEHEVFFSLDQAELDKLKIKPGQLVSYELCRGDNGRYYAINLEIVDAEES
ncbi:hypothetical protein [Pseudomonas sp. PDM27]|uniref:hypothetical protein n=1 Tax=Pseudomonas sp. PDM27 TaxID=2854769 RepID=UPI000C9ABD46|nr:hypothetical protein [Pseudomonas sp. PDM27]MBV7569158.1 hypothetical protein [Pseudomonas sp. PDM27]PNB72780.1 hypothetical protein C1X64_17925 [Pseudomonas sp. GW456-E7]